MPVTFRDLWDHHPSNATPPENAPCSDDRGHANFANQCAIRLSVAMIGAGVSLASYRGVFCWFGHGRTHALRVEELGKWLHAQSSVFGVRERVRGANATSAHFSGRTGIIMCRDFWGRGTRGDHIDLWDGSAMAGGAADYIDRSDDVWFWKIR
jgi:hypothetical protein